MNQKERIYWNVVVKMAQAGNEEMLENLESENRWRKENNLPSVEEELGLVAMTPQKEAAKEGKVEENEMNLEEIFHWKVVIILAQSGDPEKQHELDCENRLRNDYGLPPIEDVLGDEIVAKKKKRFFTKEEALERAKKYHIEKDVLWAIDQEGYTPNEAIDEWQLYEEEDFVLERKEPMVLVSLEHPEATLWAVVPKTEWEKTIPTTKGILELMKKQVSGQSFKEAIEEAEELSKQPWEPLTKLWDALCKDWRELGNEIAAYPNVLPPTHLLCRWEEKLSNMMGELHKELKEILNAPLAKESLQEQLQRLVEALRDAKVTVEPATEEDESMTVDELSEQENNLLYPGPEPVWDETHI